MRLKPRAIAIVRAVFLGATLAGYVLALALASSPQLHDFLHHDASRNQHACPATTLHSGQSEPPVTSVGIVKPVAAPPTRLAQSEPQQSESFFLRCRLLQHGPPRSLLS